MSLNGNAEALRDLLRLKEINRTADAILARIESDGDCDGDPDVLKDLITVNMYEVSMVQNFFMNTITNDSGDARGCLNQNEAKVEAWIEWRYDGTILGGSTNEKAAKLRVMTLAQMLNNAKPEGLYAPKMHRLHRRYKL